MAKTKGALMTLTPAQIADRLTDAPDLYAALRGLGQNAAVADIIAMLRAGSSAAQATAERLARVDQGLLTAVLRKGAGLPPIPAEAAIRDYLASVTPAPMFLPEIGSSPTAALLCEVQRPDMPAFSDRAFDAWFSAQGVRYGLGSYGERRSVYETPQFADAASPERRSVHLGIDVFAAAGTPVHAALPGRVLHLTYNADPLDYGHTLILQHDAGGVPFYTLCGHLGGSLPQLLKVGDPVSSGQLIAHIGDWHENGGWTPHLHFQIMTDMLDQHAGNFFGVGHPSLLDVWQSILIDPNLILRIPPDRFQV
jgi:murein DD-endopeptidase MepM/ murein hydrolase activator NlpD